LSGFFCSSAPSVVSDAFTFDANPYFFVIKSDDIFVLVKKITTFLSLTLIIKDFYQFIR